MASPWALQYDEDGNLLPAQFDAASAADVEGANRSPAGAPGMPMVLTPKGRAAYNPQTGSTFPTPRAPQPPVSAQAPAGGQAPFENPSNLQGMAQDVFSMNPRMGDQLQEKNALTEGQKHDIQHALFVSPVQMRILQEMSRGEMPEALKDEQGNVVKDPDTGEVVYNPDKTTADPNHPYQMGQRSLQAARELLNQRLRFAPNQVDLTGLMSLADAWSPKGQQSNFAASYKPHTYDQAAQAAMATMQGLTKDQIDLAKEANTSANSMKAGMVNNALTSQLLQSQMAGFGMGGRGMFQPYQMQQQFAKQVNTEGQHLASENDILNRVSGLLAQGNPSANPTIKTNLARFIEGTVRPQLAVIGQEGGDQSILQSLVNRYDSMVSGQYPPEQVGQFKNEIQLFLNQHNQKAAAFAQRAHVMNGSLPMPYDEPSLQGLLGPYLHPYGNSAQRGLNTLPNSNKTAHSPHAPGYVAPPPPAPVGPSLQDMFSEWKKSKGSK